MKTPHGTQSPETGRNKYDALLEQATDGTMVIDFENNFRDVSSGLCSMFGHNNESYENINEILATARLYLGMIEGETIVRKELVVTAKEYIDLAIGEIRALSNKSRSQV